MDWAVGSSRSRAYTSATQMLPLQIVYPYKIRIDVLSVAIQALALMNDAAASAQVKAQAMAAIVQMCETQPARVVQGLFVCLPACQPARYRCFDAYARAVWLRIARFTRPGVQST